MKKFLIIFLVLVLFGVGGYVIYKNTDKWASKEITIAQMQEYLNNEGVIGCYESFHATVTNDDGAMELFIVKKENDYEGKIVYSDQTTIYLKNGKAYFKKIEESVVSKYYVDFNWETMEEDVDSYTKNEQFNLYGILAPIKFYYIDSLAYFDYLNLDSMKDENREVKIIRKTKQNQDKFKIKFRYNLEDEESGEKTEMNETLTLLFRDSKIESTQIDSNKLNIKQYSGSITFPNFTDYVAK